MELATHSKYQINHSVTVLVYSLAGLLLYLWSVLPYGQGITDDSVNFYSAAISFPPQLLKLDGSLFVEWPPLYPILLSVYKLLNIKPLYMGIILHAISLFFTIYLIGIVVYKQIRSIYIQHTALLISVFSVPLLIINVFVWSEGIFTMLYLLLLVQLELFLTKKNNKHLILITLVAILLSFQRKTGIIIDISVVLTIVFLLKGKSFFKRLQYATVFFVLAIAPFLLYLWTRKSQTGKYFTQWETNFSNLAENCIQSLEVITTWMLPDEIHLLFRIIAILLFFSSFWLIYFQSKKFKSPEINVFQGLLMIHLIVYVLAIIFIFLFLQLDQSFDDRIFAPAYPAFLLLFFSFIDKFYYNLLLFPISNIRPLRLLFIVLLTIWCLYPVSRTIYTVNKWHQLGVGGYSHQYWLKNPLIQFLSLQPENVLIRSNNEFAIYYHMAIAGKSKRSHLISSDISNKPYLYACFEPCQSQQGEVLINTKQGKILYILE